MSNPVLKFPIQSLGEHLRKRKITDEVFVKMNPPIKLQLPSTNPSQTNVIPAFLLKVRNLLDDPTNNDLICWNLNNNVRES